MFCRNCGKEIDGKAAFCIYCGTATGIGATNGQTGNGNSFARTNGQSGNDDLFGAVNERTENDNFFGATNGQTGRTGNGYPFGTANGQTGQTWNGYSFEKANFQQEQAKKVNAFGIAGFILSLLSLYFGLYFCITSILSIVFSAIGMKKAKECRFNGLAIAGLVIGIITLAYWGIVWMIASSIIRSYY